MSRFFIVTGESSGDLLGSYLAEELIDQGHQVFGWGGQSMKQKGVQISQDISALKIMGWSDVIAKIPSIISLFSKCKKDIKRSQPDVLILIDFGSFNLRLASWGKKQGYRIVYYSPPKLWASRPGRINILKKTVDQLIVLFPFEKEYYQKNDIDALYFGHPIAETINRFSPDQHFKENNELDDRPIIAILPGSRKSEIKKTLPTYIKAATSFNDYQICVSSAQGMSSLIQSLSKGHASQIRVIEKDYHQLLQAADIALVTSGTATMEAALFNTPQVVGYKTTNLNYQIAKQLIKTKYISLVNLICDDEVVVELIQNELTSNTLKENIIRLNDVSAIIKLDEAHRHLKNILTQENGVLKTVSAITDHLG